MIYDVGTTYCCLLLDVDRQSIMALKIDVEQRKIEVAIFCSMQIRVISCVAVGVKLKMSENVTRGATTALSSPVAYANAIIATGVFTVSMTAQTALALLTDQS